MAKWKVQFREMGEDHIQCGVGAGLLPGVVFFQVGRYRISFVAEGRYTWETKKKTNHIVIAGSYHEYLEWVIATNKNPKEYKYACEPLHIAHLTDESITVYYIGRYDQNKLFDSHTLLTKHITREVYDRVRNPKTRTRT